MRGFAATTSTPTKARARGKAPLQALADLDAIAIGIGERQNSNETHWKQQVKILIEVFAAPGCSKCAQKRQALRAVTEELGADRFDWHDVNLLENVGRAVELGVMSPLSLAIDAELAFPALPTPERLRAPTRLRLNRRRVLDGHRGRTQHARASEPGVACHRPRDRFLLQLIRSRSPRSPFRSPM